MEQDFFSYLPSEIITNILSRSTVRTIAISKCVCRSWLHLLENDDFAKSHFSRSAAALAVLTSDANYRLSRCIVFELEDQIDADDHRFNHLTKFDFPLRVKIAGSVNGMLCLVIRGGGDDSLYICNPISREYIEIYPPIYREEPFIYGFGVAGDIYGFGASKTTGQYKVVTIRSNHSCHVYTLGTGSWRRAEAASTSFRFDFGCFGALVNGNLHWLVSDSNDTLWTCCFDLETERFIAFSVPPIQGVECIGGFSALRGCLCLCDHTAEDEEVVVAIVIWLMKEYGDEKSWTKEYVISLNSDFEVYRHLSVYPIKVFEDGGILMVCNDDRLLSYDSKTKETRALDVFYQNRILGIDSILLTPSFLSLKRFSMEDVISL